MVRTLTIMVVMAAFQLSILAMCGAFAGPARHVDWLTTFEIAPGDTIAAWSLVDSVDVWPSSFDGLTQKLYDAGRLDAYRYMFEEKGDYLRVIVYVKDGSRWRTTANTRVVFCYQERKIGTVEVLFPTADGRAVLSSRSGVVVGSTGLELARSTDGGYRGYLRFAPGSLPRPERRWFGGGNRWGIMPPEFAEVQEVANEEARPDPARCLPDSVRADSDRLIAGGGDR